ncbi:unnamed protein product [Adineta ricciae]|uniref:EGF-like domain-containing protein n=1 Tax=Adineta ricciae TaxID=249248 RepID=A0A813N943_ADIRI|nr:unnamed protein product [Adineta ricciae]CAF0784023.1 unnamed protein product [Adineta ricciae]
MYCIIAIVYFVLSANAYKYQILLNDEEAYNPCKPDSGVFYYPHRTDIHQYYQCDEAGNAYLRSCGALVWDDLRVACNWPDAVVPQASSSTALPSTTTTAESTTTTKSSTTAKSAITTCGEVNPCGEHGQCVALRRRFACICDDNWFGRLCDKQIDELTTPALSLDQVKNQSDSEQTFSLPVYTKEDSKYIFYGLKGDKISNFVPVQKRMMDPKEIENKNKESISSEKVASSNMVPERLSKGDMK